MSEVRTAALRYHVEVAPHEAEVAAAQLWAAGAIGVWERPTELVAWFPPPTDPLAAPADATPPLPTTLPASIAGGRVEREPDRDWQAAWKATIAPVHAGRFAVVPSWLVADHRPAPDETTLVLDPGRAFGSGHHATTTLCLELLDQLVSPGTTVADVGCGSGVLAIAAARRGARAVATDIDPDAVVVTTDNAARNAVTVPAAVGSAATARDLLGGPADVVVANLVTDTIAALASELVAATAANGTLVVSGIAADRAEVAVAALTAAGAVVTERRERDGWVASRLTVTGRPPAEQPGSPVAPAPTGRSR